MTPSHLATYGALLDTSATKDAGEEDPTSERILVAAIDKVDGSTASRGDTDCSLAFISRNQRQSALAGPATAKPSGASGTRPIASIGAHFMTTSRVGGSLILLFTAENPSNSSISAVDCPPDRPTDRKSPVRGGAA